MLFVVLMVIGYDVVFRGKGPKLSPELIDSEVYSTKASVSLVGISVFVSSSCLKCQDSNSIENTVSVTEDAGFSERISLSINKHRNEAQASLFGWI